MSGLTFAIFFSEVLPPLTCLWTIYSRSCCSNNFSWWPPRQRSEWRARLSRGWHGGLLPSLLVVTWQRAVSGSGRDGWRMTSGLTKKDVLRCARPSICSIFFNTLTEGRKPKRSVFLKKMTYARVWTSAFLILRISQEAWHQPGLFSRRWKYLIFCELWLRVCACMCVRACVNTTSPKG